MNTRPCPTAVATLLLCGLLFALCPAVAQAQTIFTVNATASPSGTADADPGDGVCATGDGVCTLRAAIQEANAAAGTQTVAFDIPSSDAGCDAATGVCELNVGGGFPPITDAVILDGCTQDGVVCSDIEQTPKLSISKAFLSGTGNGVALQLSGAGSSGSQILGFAISGFDVGISIEGSNDNIIGYNVLGTAETRNTVGLQLLGGASDNQIELNVVTGNGTGISITGDGSDGNAIRRNSIYANNRLGIDLGDAFSTNGADANDVGDGDDGPNQQQNSPVIERASVVGDRLQVWFHVDADPANAAYRLEIDLYKADADGEEGETSYPTEVYGENRTTKRIGWSWLSTSSSHRLPIWK